MNRAIHTTSAQQAGVGGIHDSICSFVGDITHVEFQRVLGADAISQVGIHSYLFVSASTPGSFLPSRNSSDAPPPVEMCVILSATPAAFTAATLSPPPMIEVAAPLSATARAIFFVPLANASISKTPIGPFHTMVRASLISSEKSSIVFGPISRAIMSGGMG